MEPDLDAFFDQLCSAYAWDFGALTVNPGLASGIVCGTNPPYSVTDFFAFYPKFGGTPVSLQGTLTSGSPSVTNIITTNVAVGQFIAGSGIPSGTTIAAITSNTLTLSQNATADGTVTLTVYVAPLMPVAVIGAYIALASASINQARWQEQWSLGMALFVAHFCTLWLRSDGSTYSNAGQAAAAGLKQGILVSASAGPVSEGLQPVTGLDAWAAWNQTTYGTQLATFAKVAGAGPVYIY